MWLLRFVGYMLLLLAGYSIGVEHAVDPQHQQQALDFGKLLFENQLYYLIGLGFACFFGCIFVRAGLYQARPAPAKNEGNDAPVRRDS